MEKSVAVKDKQRELGVDLIGAHFKFKELCNKLNQVETHNQ